MNGKRFLILTYAGDFIDLNLLEKGLYNTAEPRLYTQGTTIDGLIESGKQVTDMVGGYFLNDSYFDNLKKCSLTLVELSVVK